MPTYPLVCTACNHRYELRQSIKLDLPKKCPECGKSKLSQDFDVPRNNHVYVYGEPTTVGAQAEANAKRFGKELTALKQGKIGPEAEAAKKAADAKRPFWRKTNEVLKPSKIKDIKKYILTGEK